MVTGEWGPGCYSVSLLLWQSDISTQTSSQAAAYILGLPPVLQAAVKADTLPPLDPFDAINLLVQQTVAREKQSFMDSVIRPPIASSPIECRLYEEVCMY